METAQTQDAASALLSLSTIVVDPPAAESSSMDASAEPQPGDTNEASTETDLRAKDLDKMEKDLKAAQARVDKMSLDEESFRGNDEKVKTFTGLPTFTILMALFTIVKPFLKTKSPVMSPFSQFLMTLMRLKMNLGVDYLAYRFGVSQSTVTNTFTDVIDVMFYKMVPALVTWPTREALRKTLPTIFRAAHKACVCIIDCFEIFIERSSNLKARAQTWSQYKHHNTMKYLIAVAPQGVISFISKGWGGRSSDVNVTDHCGLLDKLLPLDLVLADRGFDIGEMLEKVLATLGIPAFTKGKTQLDPVDIEQTRRLANVRIHVERLIGLCREKYTILKSTIPIVMLNTDANNYMQLDKIVAVCCALTNCCPSIVPFD